jgi:hypothetical protein
LGAEARLLNSGRREFAIAADSEAPRKLLANPITPLALELKSSSRGRASDSEYEREIQLFPAIHPLFSENYQLK